MAAQRTGNTARTSDVETFVPVLKKITLNDGSTYEIPKLDLRADLALLRALSGVMEKVIHTGLFGRVNEGELNEEQMGVQLVGILLRETPEAIVSAASAILRQTEEWTLDNIDLEGAVALVVPFLQTRLARVMEQFGKAGKIPAGLGALLKTGSRPS